MAKMMVMCVIFLEGLLNCVNAADINAYGIKYGNINAKTTVDGSLNIDDGDITIVYGIGGHSDQGRILRRADIGGNEYVKKMEKESSIYVSDTADIIYHQDLKRDGTTVSYGFVYENGVLQYFNGRGQVLVLPENKAGAEYSKLAPDFNCTQPKDRTLHAKHTAAEDLDPVAVIKLLVFVDSAVLDRFQEMTKNNVTQTRDDIKKFFALSASEMTQMFQSLKQYDNVYHRGVHSPTTQDFAVEVVAVILPPTGNDFAFSKNNVDMTGRLAAGALDDFGAFVRSFVSAVPYDHATFVTGYDLVLGDADLLGYSYADTMCKQSSFSSGYHTSVIEFTSTISRTWAHELGHGLGMLHDQDVGCGDQTYIMSAGSISQLSDTAAYSKTFSTCSYLSLQRYTNRISGVDLRPSCFMPTRTDVREGHSTSRQQVTCEPLTETCEPLTETCESLTKTGDSKANMCIIGRFETSTLSAIAFEPANVTPLKMAQTSFTCPCVTTECCRAVFRSTRPQHCCVLSCVRLLTVWGADCIYRPLPPLPTTTSTTIIPTATTATLVPTTITITATSTMTVSVTTSVTTSTVTPTPCICSTSEQTTITPTETTATSEQTTITPTATTETSIQTTITPTETTATSEQTTITPTATTETSIQTTISPTETTATSEQTTITPTATTETSIQTTITPTATTATSVPTTITPTATSTMTVSVTTSVTTSTVTPTPCICSTTACCRAYWRGNFKKKPCTDCDGCRLIISVFGADCVLA